MKFFILSFMLFLLVSCSSGGGTNSETDSSVANQIPGNSSGSNITGADTARMDTSMQTPLKSN